MTKPRFVYFVQQGDDGPIKIGLAIDVGKRLDHLMAANSAELIVKAIIPGSVELESELHLRFARHVIRGEWFRPAPEIVEYIASLPAVLLRDLKYRRKYKALLPLDEAKAIWDNPALTSQEARSLLTGWSSKRITAVLGPRRFDYRGRHSAENGKKSTKGRVPVDYEDSVKKDFYDVWHNRKLYPTWDDCRVKFKELNKLHTLKHKFTVDRAYELWGKRT